MHPSLVWMMLKDVYLQEGPTCCNQGRPVDTVLLAALEAVETVQRAHRSFTRVAVHKRMSCRCVCMCKPTLLGPNTPFFMFFLELDSAAGAGVASILDATGTNVSRLENRIQHICGRTWTWTYLDMTGPEPQEHTPLFCLHLSSLSFLLMWSHTKKHQANLEYEITSSLLDIRVE